MQTNIRGKTLFLAFLSILVNLSMSLQKWGFFAKNAKKCLKFVENVVLLILYKILTFFLENVNQTIKYPYLFYHIFIKKVFSQYFVKISIPKMGMKMIFHKDFDHTKQGQKLILFDFHLMKQHLKNYVKIIFLQKKKKR